MSKLLFGQCIARCCFTAVLRSRVVQKCRWTFLMFSGTFSADLSVRQIPEQRDLLFELASPGFMQEFEGRWKVTEGGMGWGLGGI